MNTPPRFLPALGHRRLAPLYDPLLRRVMREDMFKRRLIASAGLAGRDTLDLGCGTGTLTLMARRTHPEAKVVGLDVDADILIRAHAKAERIGLVIPWIQGRADRLPHPRASFDRVLICLVLHHLDPETRFHSLREVLRVLRPGGEVHIADFGPPRTLAMKFIAAIMRHLEQTADLFDGRLPDILGTVGFDSVVESGHVDTPLGPLILLHASKPRHLEVHLVEWALPGAHQAGQTDQGIATLPGGAGHQPTTSS
jgi:ubiquinone/menaquinone biosynthesis C-methylase UbiE